MLVETQPGPDGEASVIVQSTVQLDGDVTAAISRLAVGNEAVLLSHLVEVEARVQAVATTVRWIGRTVSGATWVLLIAVIGTAYSLGDIFVCAISGVISTVLMGIIRTSPVRRLLLTFLIRRLSHVTPAYGPPPGP